LPESLSCEAAKGFERDRSRPISKVLVKHLEVPYTCLFLWISGGSSLEVPTRRG
jgi:hypothetical protein